MNKTCTAIAIIAALALSACGGSTSSGVPWNDYSPNVRTTIDALATTKDCTGLQGQFDSADSNGSATMTRTGHNNAALMGYINDQMKSAGC